jgi:hypothetical protein
VHEKGHAQAFDGTVPLLSLATEQPARCTHADTRHGTPSLVAVPNEDIAP